MKIFALLFFLNSLGYAAIDLSDPAEVVHALVEANYQKSAEAAIFQLFEIEEGFFQALQSEVLQLIADQAPSTATKEGHNSNWSKPQGVIEQYSLLNRSGKCDDYSTDHNRSIKQKKFWLAKHYPHLGQFIQLFPHAVNFRINVLHAKSQFTQHQEDICFSHLKTGKPALRVRFHLPIATNDQAFMLMEGSVYHFEPGRIYFFHNGCIHDGVNGHPEKPRIHLLWDMLLTEDTFSRMFARDRALSYLNPLDEISLAPVERIGIDPHYKRTERKLSYESVLQATLCPIQ